MQEAGARENETQRVERMQRNLWSQAVPHSETGIKETHSAGAVAEYYTWISGKGMENTVKMIYGSTMLKIWRDSGGTWDTKGKGSAKY